MWNIPKPSLGPHGYEKSITYESYASPGAVLFQVCIVAQGLCYGLVNVPRSRIQGLRSERLSYVYQSSTRRRGHRSI
ncbi:hypothetical protein OG21DRAFT_1505357 [Imleria badia]|nr:hypothetical protein OG21DRAFT_1505357 [Imleria badia]